jgi:4-alpha-glucanotransferase
MNDVQLSALAQAAGLSTHWTDAFGQARQVGEDSLRAALRALQLPADTDAECRDSLAELQAPARPPVLLTARSGQPAGLPAGTFREGDAYQLQLEDGTLRQGRLAAGPHGHPCLEAVTETGYHQLICRGLQTTLAVAPQRCFGVADALQGKPIAGGTLPWGLAVQLYSLRRPHDGGLGDFTALETLARAAAAQKASALAISPVHAMFSADPGRFSPYGPSSRLFFNVLHIDPARVLGPEALQQALREELELPGSRSNLAHLEAAERVDWPAAAAHRLALLRRLFGRFRNGAGDSQGFDGFRVRGGQALQDHACFEALDAWFREHQPHAVQGDWRHWPAPYRDPRSAEVQAFAQEHAQDMAFHQWLQWQTDAGRHAAQAAAHAAGMPIGLIADLAVGANPGGSQGWGAQAAMLTGLTVGAPPDLLSRQGQGWGLGAFSPRALRAQGFAPWLDMLRANMRHSGGIRIDHVLGLQRLWLVPDGAPASEGVYLHYPLEDMLRLLALESLRQHAIVIGEDLGTVPEGFPQTLATAGVLGIRVLWFQREKEKFLAPQAWPATAMATTSTHDLPTVAGWWKGQDITWRERLALLPPDGLQHAEREADRHCLWQALQQAGCASPGELPDAPPIEEVLAFTGSTPAALVMAPLEDVLGIAEQPNLPGTVAIHPNWQQRLPRDADLMLGEPLARQRLAALERARNSAAARHDPAPAGDAA